MLYSDIQANVLSILNRRDCTPSQLKTFIGLAIQRIQRKLRVPAMEAVVIYNTTGDPLIPVPGDLLELIDLTTNDSVNQQKLVRTDHQSAIRLSNRPGVPTSYFREQGNFRIGPNPPVGTTIYINYFQDASGLSGDSDHNWITDATPDLLIYGTLSHACDFFVDDRMQSFEGRFNQLLDDVQIMATQDELSNASISPAYRDQPYPYYAGGGLITLN